MNNSGSITIMVLLVIFLLTVLFLSAGFYLEIALKEIYSAEVKDDMVTSLREKAEKVVKILLDDPSPGSDSPYDPVWNKLKNLKDDEEDISLADVSSRFGINWIRKEFLVRMKFIKHGRSANDFQQYREDKGPMLNIIEGYGNYIDKDVLKNYFTPYSYFNVNISGEFVLRNLFSIRTSDVYESEKFHKDIQEARIRKKIIERENLKSFIGAEYFNYTFPVLNAEPVMNINFVNERIIGILFNYFGVPQKKKKIIIEARKKTELSNDDLKKYMGKIYTKTLLHHYMGTITWFWKIEVSKNDDRLEWIIARVPTGNDDKEHNFRLIEENIYE